jgi:hypothetical protein
VVVDSFETFACPADGDSSGSGNENGNDNLGFKMVPAGVTISKGEGSLFWVIESGFFSATGEK